MGNIISNKNWTWVIKIHGNIVEVKVIKKLTGKVDIMVDG